MSASTTAVTSLSVYTTPAFWERLWRTSGIQFVGLFVVAWLIYGYQGRGRRAGSAGRYHVAGRFVGTGRRLLALRLAHPPPPVGRGREPRALDAKSCHACRMVTPTTPAR